MAGLSAPSMPAAGYARTSSGDSAATRRASWRGTDVSHALRRGEGCRAAPHSGTELFQHLGQMEITVTRWWPGTGDECPGRWPDTASAVACARRRSSWRNGEGVARPCRHAHIVNGVTRAGSMSKSAIAAATVAGEHVRPGPSRCSTATTRWAASTSKYERRVARGVRTAEAVGAERRGGAGPRNAPPGPARCGCSR